MAESLESGHGDFASQTLDLLVSIEQRCRKFAVGLPQQDQLQSFWEGVMFYVGEERLISPLSDIKEILNYPSAMTRVPGTKPWILGLANVRGDLLTIVDLAWFLKGKTSTVSMLPNY